MWIWRAKVFLRHDVQRTGKFDRWVSLFSIPPFTKLRLNTLTRTTKSDGRKRKKDSNSLTPSFLPSFFLSALLLPAIKIHSWRSHSLTRPAGLKSWHTPPPPRSPSSTVPTIPLVSSTASTGSLSEFVTNTYYLFIGKCITVLRNWKSRFSWTETNLTLTHPVHYSSGFGFFSRLSLKSKTVYPTFSIRPSIRQTDGRGEDKKWARLANYGGGPSPTVCSTSTGGREQGTLT